MNEPLVGDAAGATHDDDDEVVCVGQRSVEERNAEGFANAIELEESPAKGPPVAGGGGSEGSAISIDDESPGKADAPPTDERTQQDAPAAPEVWAPPSMAPALHALQEAVAMDKEAKAAAPAAAAGRSKRERKLTRKALELQGAAGEEDHEDVHENEAPQRRRGRHR